MADAVGMTVWVQLKQPRAALYGQVQDLVPNSHLTLQNVFFPHDGTRWEHLTVQATAIENLEVVDPKSIPHSHPTPSFTPQQRQQQPHFPHQQNHQYPSYPATQQPPPDAPYPRPPIPIPSQHQTAQTPNSHPANITASAPTPQRQPPNFVDPAIVSFAASPARDASEAQPTPEPVQTPIKSMLTKAAQGLPNSPGSPFIGEIGRANVGQKLAAAKPQTSGAIAPYTLRASVISPDVAKPDVAKDVSAPEAAAAKKRARRSQQTKKQAAPIADPPPIMNAEVSRNGNDMDGGEKRGKGWRNTPLLQPSLQSVPLSKANAKKSRRRQQGDASNTEFAQGDTTDIQDMGDFDFEGELKKFDKKQVFDEIRQGDTTADEDRLVSHNRAHRPGTHGGKNLHPTEPVLSPKLGPKYHSNELDSSSDADTELMMGDGRSSSRHSISRSAGLGRRQSSRQNSGHLDLRAHPLAAAIQSDRALNRSATSLVSRGKKAPSSRAASSPRPDHVTSPPPTSKDVSNRLSKTLEPHLAILPNFAPCPTLLPRALDTLEAATISTFGTTTDAYTESSARFIAEAALSLGDDQAAPRRPSRTQQRTNAPSSSASNVGRRRNSDPAPNQVVVILAGNHALGARALAAGRHLASRGLHIIAAEGLFETVDTQHPQVQAQSAVLRRMQRAGATIKRGLWRKASNYIKTLTGPPVVIIDALLGGSTYEELASNSTPASSAAPASEEAMQREAREIIDWANRSRAPVLSVGCPSGVSGVDGRTTLVDGEPLAVRPDRVLALGVPMQGLLGAMEMGEKWGDDTILLADIGLNLALKSDEAPAFGAAYCVECRFVDGRGQRTED